MRSGGRQDGDWCATLFESKTVLEGEVGDIESSGSLMGTGETISLGGSDWCPHIDEDERQDERVKGPRGGLDLDEGTEAQPEPYGFTQ